MEKTGNTEETIVNLNGRGHRLCFLKKKICVKELGDQGCGKIFILAMKEGTQDKAYIG